MNIASLALACALATQTADPPRQRYPGAAAAAEAAGDEGPPPAFERAPAKSGAPFERPPAKSSDPFDKSGSARDAASNSDKGADKSAEREAPAIKAEPIPVPSKSKTKGLPARPLSNPLRRDTPASSPAAATPIEKEPPAKRAEPAVVLPTRPATLTPRGETVRSEPVRSEPVREAPRGAAEKSAEPDDLVARGAEGQGPKVSAKDLIGGLVVAPGGLGLEGEPLRLADAFTRSRRFPPADVAQAYWALAAATAEYHQRRSEAEELEVLGRALGDAGGEPAELKVALGGARAALAESKLAALAAQQRLAQFTGFSPANKPPVVADFPHTGTYQTFLSEIFAGRQPPPEMILLDRMLPLEREAVLARAQSSLAALDHLEAAMGEIDSGRGDVRITLAAIAEHGRQQRALVRAAELYNRDIARYAMQAAPPGLDPLRLAGMLIRVPAPTPATPGRSAPVLATPPGTIRRAENTIPADEDGIDRQVVPAAFEEGQVNDPAWQPSPEQASEPATETRPTIRSIYVPKANTPTTSPVGTPRNEGVIPAAGSVLDAIREAPRGDPRQSSTQGVLRQRTDRPRSGGPGLYSGLAGRPAAEQAVNLAGLLGGHPDPGADARLASLEECQTLAAGRDPRQVQSSYARAATLAARCEVLAATQVQLVELEGGAAAAPRGMLAVRSASARTAADLAGTKAELIAARWSLTQATGQNLRSAWLYPSKSLAAPAWLVQKGEDDPRTATPGRDPRALYRVALTQRAAAVVAADTARVSQVERWQTGKEPLEGALSATAAQQDATLEFVATLARMYEAN